MVNREVRYHYIRVAKQHNLQNVISEGLLRVLVSILRSGETLSTCAHATCYRIIF